MMLQVLNKSFKEGGILHLAVICGAKTQYDVVFITPKVLKNHRK